MTTRHLRDGSVPGLVLEYEVTRVHRRLRTPYQEVLIGETRAFGKALFMDGNIQSAEVDEALYHAALVHPAMLAHRCPRRVLIGGGGEGATLREVLRHPEVERVTMVDIDEQAVAACREHLPEWHRGAFDDPRVDLVFDDVRRVLEAGEHRYDAVILDLGDPVSSETSQHAATREFYGLVRRALAAEGVMGMQAGEFETARQRNYGAFVRTLAAVFERVHPYRLAVPSFCSVWGFVLAAPWDLPSVPPDIEERVARLQDLRHYDARGHRSMFWLSRAERDLLARSGAVLTDEAPIPLAGGSLDGSGRV